MFSESRDSRLEVLNEGILGPKNAAFVQEFAAHMLARCGLERLETFLVDALEDEEGFHLTLKTVHSLLRLSDLVPGLHLLVTPRLSQSCMQLMSHDSKPGKAAAALIKRWTILQTGGFKLRSEVIQQYQAAVASAMGLGHIAAASPGLAPGSQPSTPASAPALADPRLGLKQQVQLEPKLQSGTHSRTSPVPSPSHAVNYAPSAVFAQNTDSTMNTSVPLQSDDQPPFPEELPMSNGNGVADADVDADKPDAVANPSVCVDSDTQPPFPDADLPDAATSNTNTNTAHTNMDTSGSLCSLRTSLICFVSIGIRLAAISR